MYYYKKIFKSAPEICLCLIHKKLLFLGIWLDSTIGQLKVIAGHDDFDQSNLSKK